MLLGVVLFYDDYSPTFLIAKKEQLKSAVLVVLMGNGEKKVEEYIHTYVNIYTHTYHQPHVRTSWRT